MRVTVIGCAGSFAGPHSAASCYLVQTDHEGRTWSILLDLGNGALGVLQRHLDFDGIDAIVLSHLHADHCLDMCGLYVVQRYFPHGARPPIPVYAPVGAADRLGRAYGVDEPEDLTETFTFHDLADREEFCVGPFRVTPHRVFHPVETYGLRVSADGVTLAYTADTDLDDRVVELCREATMVIADSAFVDGRDHAVGVHMNGRQCAEAAVAAGGVERLMLSHLPAWNDPEVCRSQAAEVWPGAVEIAQAERTYEL